MNGILDTDLYKLTMQQAIINLFPRSIVRYKFHNRGKTLFPEGFGLELKMEISAWEQYRLELSPKLWLKEKYKFLSPAYLDFLSGYSFDPSEVSIIQTPHGTLDITIEGPWYRTILWEVPLLAAISELYYRMTKPSILSSESSTLRNLVKVKIIKENKLTVADFGTRRRFSYENHKRVINDMQHALIGTSNVKLAWEYNLKPIGTHAHEWFQYHAVKYGYQAANYMALKNWIKIFKGDLGIALPDTYTSDVFYQSFNTEHSKLFDGVRHDSGYVTSFIRKTVNHYKSCNIDPSTKTIVFSDSLNVDDAVLIKGWCDQVGIKCAFGIGTYLTNDVEAKPLNIVIKLDAVYGRNKQWLPSIKLSDTPGKHTGNEDEIKLCKEVLRCS